MPRAINRITFSPVAATTQGNVERHDAWSCCCNGVEGHAINGSKHRWMRGGGVKTCSGVEASVRRKTGLTSCLGDKLLLFSRILPPKSVNVGGPHGYLFNKMNLRKAKSTAPLLNRVCACCFNCVYSNTKIHNHTRASISTRASHQRHASANSPHHQSHHLLPCCSNNSRRRAFSYCCNSDEGDEIDVAKRRWQARVWGWKEVVFGG